jgi:hypothetical protein
MSQLSQHEEFAPYVGKRFSFEGQPVVLVLAKVEAQAAGYSGRTPFILIFHGPAGDVLPEGLHTAQIEGGPFTAFYVAPIHTVARDRQEYQAVFN